MESIWPLRPIRIVTSDIELFVPDEDSLAAAALLTADGVYDPVNRFIPRSPVAGWSGKPAHEAEVEFLRYYWASLADWRADRWNLICLARINSEIVGVQEIGAQSFAVTKTISTGSWIGRDYQGKGLGTAMRQAALHFAFEGIGADRADSSAWSTNSPSLSISKSMGYLENGTSIRAFEGKRQTQINLVLNASDWHNRAQSCQIFGLSEAALVMMGAPVR